MGTAQRVTDITVTKEKTGKKDSGEYFVRQAGKPVQVVECLRKSTA